MPKLNRDELSILSDHETDPTFRGLNEEDQLAHRIGWAVAEISTMINHRQRADRFLDRDLPDEEYQHFSYDYMLDSDPPNPEYLWTELSHLRDDLEASILPSNMRQQILGEIKEVEEKVYMQFAPYIEFLVDRFGYDNSPLSVNPSLVPMHQTDVDREVENAVALIQSSKLSESEKATEIQKIESARKRLVDYTNEPCLFTVEQEFSALCDLETDYLMFLYQDPSRSTIQIGSPSHVAVIGPIQKYQDQLSRMTNMVSKMTNTELKQQYQQILSDAQFRLNESIRIAEEASQPYDFDKPQFDGNISYENALKIFNLPTDFTPDQLKKAYHALAKIHHPDTGSNTPEIMQQINVAFDLLNNRSTVVF